MKITIIYNSHSGTTMGFAKSIGKYMEDKEAEVQIGSIDNYDKEFLSSADLVLLGCWTSGLFFFAQHPDKPWNSDRFREDLFRNAAEDFDRLYDIVAVPLGRYRLKF